MMIVIIMIPIENYRYGHVVVPLSFSIMLGIFLWDFRKIYIKKFGHGGTKKQKSSLPTRADDVVPDEGKAVGEQSSIFSTVMGGGTTGSESKKFSF
jgi:hypothetical protein